MEKHQFDIDQLAFEVSKAMDQQDFEMELHYIVAYVKSDRNKGTRQQLNLADKELRNGTHWRQFLKSNGVVFPSTLSRWSSSVVMTEFLSY